VDAAADEAMPEDAPEDAVAALLADPAPDEAEHPAESKPATITASTALIGWAPICPSSFSGIFATSVQ
jgi:hypothetical protein